MHRLSYFKLLSGLVLPFLLSLVLDFCLTYGKHIDIGNLPRAYIYRTQQIGALDKFAAPLMMLCHVLLHDCLAAVQSSVFLAVSYLDDKIGNTIYMINTTIDGTYSPHLRSFCCGCI